jgi:integrase
MATKRQRASGKWEYAIKRKRLLPSTLYLTFDTEAEGDRYVARLEALLDRGIVPEEFKTRADVPVHLAGLIRAYMTAHPVPATDRPWLGVIMDRLGTTKLSAIDYAWVESWITKMKREQGLVPTTIRHYVGALARGIDWAERRGVPGVGPNPLRRLPRRYATYSDTDAAAARALGKDVRGDVERDRRLHADEEARIRAVLGGEKPEGRQRPLELHWQGALECLFELALESAMRMREMYTLSPNQVDLRMKTVFLDRTKNGDKRQVPLTSVAIKALETYKDQVRRGQRGMEGFSLDGRRLFPWWNGRPESLSMTTSRLSQQFGRVFAAAGCPDLRFHDLRHEATSRFFERSKLSDIQISRITGHKELRVLRRYANLRGSDLAGQLW